MFEMFGETSLIYFLWLDKIELWKFFIVYMEETKNCWFCRGLILIKRTISVIRVDLLNKWRLNLNNKALVHPEPRIHIKKTFVWRHEYEAKDVQSLVIPIGHFRYIKILTWLRGLGEWNRRNHPSTSLLILLFYSPKPRSQVRILIYRKWSI